jgi:hypothetical protein
VGAAGSVCWAGLGCFVPGWPSWLLSPFFCSDIFLFYFLFCFLSFAFWLPTDSNNFVNFSKIQSIKVGQSETSFQNKIRFSVKPYEF